MDDEIVFVDYDVTCETAGCGNMMITITVRAPAENPYFVCGPCGLSISNVQLVEN